MSFQITSYRKPRPRREVQRKELNPKGEKGKFWDFVTEINNRFFLRIGMPAVCQKCEGTSYCGPLTPAHMKRRQDIRKGDFYNGLRVVPLGSHCHYEIDALGRRAAEPILEALRTEALTKCDITEEGATKLLATIADEIQAEGKFTEYHVDL